MLERRRHNGAKKALEISIQTGARSATSTSHSNIESGNNSHKTASRQVHTGERERQHELGVSLIVGVPKIKLFATELQLLHERAEARRLAVEGEPESNPILIDEGAL